jgi:hypothetical protein
VREWLLSSQARILYGELPNVDTILRLLNDILLVRSLCMHELEMELYDKLIYIHRDTALLIQLTRETESKSKQKKRQ